jgi:murein DD-endopeptidase MepM/ murein hydrolase activator NlpD
VIYRRPFTIAVCLLLALAVATPAFADPRDDKARVDRALASTRAALEDANDRVADAAEALSDVQARLPDAQRRLAEANRTLRAAKARADSATRAARVAAQNVTKAQARLRRAEHAVEEARDRLSALSADAYRSGGLSDLNAIMGATPADLADRLSYVENLAARQREALDQVTAARRTAVQAQNEQLRAQQAADQARRTTDRALREATTARNAAAAAQAEITTLVAQREEALRVAAEERDATLARYKELQAESARIAAEIQALARSGGSPTISRGVRLSMPVRGWKSSDFGMRYHPIYHVWRLHTGVDFAAAGGSPIWAAADGRVFRAGWNGGYGNFTCVYHGVYAGKGFATCYAHQSVILVSVGQRVKRGQQIGRVGTTGTSTGNHLHFEVRLDGQPVDPVPWLPACLC